MWRRWRFAALALLSATLLAPVGGVVRAQAFCPDGTEGIPSGAALQVLGPLLPDTIGEPTECEHVADNGDLLQATSGGLAYWQAGTQTAHFTDGADDWWYADGALVSRASAPAPVAADAPAAETAPPPAPTVGQSVTPPPSASNLMLLGFEDGTTATTRPHLYVARRRCTFATEAFPRGSSDASVTVSFSPNVDDSLDKSTRIRLTTLLPGVPSSRTAAGPVATAIVGVTTSHWTSYTDRVIQEIVTPIRPFDDRIPLQMTGDGIAPVRNSGTDYVVSDATNVTRFFVHSPTAVDQQNRRGSVTLSWTAPNAALVIDPSFLSVAAYPVTVSMTVEFAGILCATS
jgi:hypothetical protein